MFCKEIIVEVLVPTVNNTFTVTQRSGSTTITGTDVVNVVQRSGTLTIGSNHYRITNLDLNAFVMHDDPANTFVAFDGVVQEPEVVQITVETEVQLLHFSETD